MYFCKIITPNVGKGGRKVRKEGKKEGKEEEKKKGRRKERKGRERRRLVQYSSARFQDLVC